LLFWYKSANSDAAGEQCAAVLLHPDELLLRLVDRFGMRAFLGFEVLLTLDLLAVLVQQYQY
jgi:hypothetical protein